MADHLEEDPDGDVSSGKKSIFLRALDFDDEAERSAYLDHACAGNKILRGELDALLEVKDRTGFLDPQEIVGWSGELGDDQPGLAFPSTASHYDLGPEIGRGGMGTIRLAEDKKLKRTVAIKSMHWDDDAPPSAKARFLLEAEVLAHLAHPNIVPIYDIEWESGRPSFYTMKLVKGRTLQSVIDDLRETGPGEYSLDRLLSIFRKICDAVAFAHSRGIIHRDLKPENVMVGEFGEVLVMDWGIAKKIGAESIREIDDALNPQLETLAGTIQGEVFGTPRYMSPEQASGDIEQIDRRSDIFSLGGILYSILTLRPPVEGETLDEVLKKVTEGEILPPNELKTRERVEARNVEANEKSIERRNRSLPHFPNGKVPQALSAVTMKALSLSKADRYQEVESLSADVESFEQGFATSAETAGLGTQLLLLIKRNKGIFSTAAAAWLLITALVVVFVINLRTKEQRALAGEQSARVSLAAAQLNLADEALRDDDGLEAQAELNKVPMDLRESTWDYLMHRTDTTSGRLSVGAEIKRVKAHPSLPGIFGVFDADLQFTLFDVRERAKLLQFDAGVSPRDNSFTQEIAFSFDGKLVALGCSYAEGGIAIHSAEDGRLLQSWGAIGTDSLDFSPDGKLLLQTSVLNSNTVNIWDPFSGKRIYEQVFPVDGGTFAKFTAEGLILVATAGLPLRLLDPRDGRVIQEYGKPKFLAKALAYHAEGGAAVGDKDGIVDFYRLKNSELSSTFRARNTLIEWLAFSRDGDQLIVAGSHSDGQPQVDLWNPRKGEKIRSLLGGRAKLNDLSVHPVSGEVLVASKEAPFWSLDSNSPKVNVGRTWRAAPSNVNFLGAEDLVLCPRGKTRMGLYRFTEDEISEVWVEPGVSEEDEFRCHDSSRDGTLAVMMKRPEAPILGIFQKSDSGLEEVARFEVGEFFPKWLRLSPAKNRVLVGGGINSHFPGLYDIPSHGERVNLDIEDCLSCNDATWIDDRTISALVTKGAGRGENASEEWVVNWDLESGRQIRETKHVSSMNVLVANSAGIELAEAGTDKHVRIRDSKTLEVKQEFRAHDDDITAFAWHPTKRVLASASNDLTIKLWNLDSGELMEEFNGSSVIGAQSLAFSPSGRLLASAAAGNVTQVWEPKFLREAKPGH